MTNRDYNFKSYSFKKLDYANQEALNERPISYHLDFDLTKSGAEEITRPARLWPIHLYRFKPLRL